MILEWEEKARTHLTILNEEIYVKKTTSLRNDIHSAIV